MADIFISYSRRDADFVRQLHHTLEERGLETWVDWAEIPPSSEWLPEIYGGIEGANAFIFVLSPDSVSSEICAKELEHAISHNKRRIPILYREVDPGLVPRALASQHWISFTDPNHFTAACDLVVSAFNADLKWAHTHTRILTRAIEWEGSQQDRSVMLQGGDLQRAESWLAEAATGKEPRPTTLQVRYILESRRLATRRSRTAVGFVAASLALALILTLAVWQQRIRTTQFMQADLHEKAMLSLANSDPIQAEVLFATALTEEDRHESRDRLLQVRSQVPALLWVGPGSPAAPILCISRDARLFLLHKAPKSVDVWDTQARRSVRVIDDVPPDLLSSSFGPADKLLALGAGDGEIRLYSLDGTRSPFTLHSSHHRILALAFGPSGHRLASGSEDGTIEIWDLGRRTRVRELLGHTGKIDAITFSPDGLWLASGSADYQVGLWRLATGDHLMLAGHQDEVLSVDFSPDHKLLASGSFDNKVWLWDVGHLDDIKNWKTRNGTPLRVLEGHTGGVYSVSFSPSSKLLASASEDRTARLWNVEEGKSSLALRGFGGSLMSVAFSKDGNRLAAGGADGQLRLWDIASIGHRPEAFTLLGHVGQVTSSAFNRSGALLVTGGQDKSVRLWDIPSEREIAVLRSPYGQVTSVNFSPDDNWIVSGGKAGVIDVWDASRKTLHRALNGHTGQVWTVSYSPNGKWILSGSEDGTVRLWDAAKLNCIRVITTGQGKVLAAAFSHDGHVFATGGDYGGVKLWDVATGRLLRTYAASKGALWMLSFSPDDRSLAAASESGLILVWDINGALIRSLEGHEGAVWDVAYDPTGTHLVSAGNDGTVRIWDLRSRDVTVLNGDNGPIWSAVYNRTGTMIASTCQDGTIRVWRTAGLNRFYAEKPRQLLQDAEHQTGLTCNLQSFSVAPMR